MGLSKKPEVDKKPISREKLTQLLSAAKKPKIKAELPSLMQVPDQKKQIKIPTAIEPARAEGTFVPKKFQPGYTPSEVFDRTLDNTVKMISNQMGEATPEKGTYQYDVIKNDLLKSKQLFTTTQDEEGKPVFGLKTTAAEDFMAGLNDFTKIADKGIDYAISDKSKNVDALEDVFKKRFTTGLSPVNNPILYGIGQMSKPLAQGISGAMTGMALGGVYGAGAGFLGGALSTFALSAPEGVSAKYAYELEDAYIRAREEGFSKDEAYEKANSVAKVAAGGEVGMQTIYSMFGTPGQIGGTRALGLASPKPILNESAKKGFAAAASKFVDKSMEFVKPGVFLGTEAALATGVSESEAAKQGLKTEDSIEKAISIGSDFAVMDMAIKTALGMFKVPGYLKAQAKNLIETSDRNIVRDFARQGEASGVYPAGSTSKLSSEISSHSKAKEMSPKYPGDDTREAVVAGLTQKLNNLVEQQGKLADIHKADLQPQIDELKGRIELAKTAKNPLEAELNDDGTPLILTNKNKDYATQESTGKVQETTTEGGIAEREGVIGKQQEEAVGTTKTDEAGVGDSVVVSEGQVEQAPIVSLADKIRRFKIDESVLTGGDKGVAQSNIAGLPIAIYNASIEAIAKGVEAGGKLADLIEQQVQSLREGGYKFQEDKFRKNVSLIDRVSNEKSTIKAESEMAGIKSSDYSSLQRFALEKYNDASGIYRDPEMLAKALREELNKKMDTSGISDEAFEMIAYDAVVNEKQAPFVPKPAKKIDVLGVEPEAIVTNPKEVFKAMYTAATNVDKSVQERLGGAANMISEYIKKKDKLNVAPKDIAKAMSKYISSKMDSETATEVFVENLSDIIENAKDANQIAANKATIKKIKKDAKSPTYGTIAGREMTQGIEFMSPAKIKDSVNPDNTSEVVLSAAEKRKKYQELLNDYRNSITGNPTKSRTARLDLIDFIDAERKNFDEYVERKANEKRDASGRKYDSLVREEKIDPTVVSRDEFIDADTKPTKLVSEETEEAIEVAEVDKREAYKDVVNSKRNDLREEVNLGNVDADDLDDVNFLLNVDLDKVSSRNMKLISNIIDDVLNGESPSRVGDIRSDVGATDAITDLKSRVGRIRDIAKAKFSGITRKVRQAFDKAYQGAEEAYEELGITNMVRAYTMNSKEETAFRSIILGGFEKAVKITNTQAKKYTDTLYQIFAKDSVDIDGQKVSLKGEAPLSEKNSQKIGIVAALLNFENPLNTINSIIESTKILSSLKDRKYDAMVKERLLALRDLGVIDYVPSTLDEIQELSALTDFDLDAAVSMLNKRERVALDFIINENKKIAPQLNKVSRNYFGEGVDMSNPNYVGMQTFFTDVMEDFDKAFEEPLFNPMQVNKMRASSTMQRSKEMISPLSSKDKTVHYDFDIFTTQPKRYHESVTTINTTEQTRQMAKMFARKEFQDFMKGKYNIEPRLLKDNMRVFKNIITEYVNGERKPYVVTREIARQRSAISKFFYSRMLNSLEAGALQYAPNIPSLILESPQSWAKSLEVTSSSIFDTEKKDALMQFLSQTSKASRVNAGFEALTKSAKSISDNSILRYSSNAYKNIDNFLGLSIEYGDRLTTVQSLLTGYIKELIKKGKIKNASEFDIVAEVKNGLDQDALSSAENLMSFINNESSTYGKAKVFRKDWSNVLRMLQSFSHNAATNFLIDLGRFTDDMAGVEDRLEANKRMLQYLFGVSGYGFAAYGINEMKTKFARDYMKSRGIIEDGEDLDKAVEQDRDKTKTLMTNGILFDALLSRQNVVSSEIIKGSLDMGYQLFKKPLAEEKEMMGEDIRNTTLSKEYSPFYESKYMGTAGSFISDFQKLAMELGKDVNEDNYKSLLVEKQKEAYKTIRSLQAMGMFMPSKDLRKATSAASKALRQGKITQLEKDAQNYIVATSKVSDGKYTQAQIDAAKEYMDEQRKIAKYPSEFDAYVKTKVKDFAENKIQRQELIAGAKRFGDAFARDVVNIKASSPNKKISILNNRFPDVDLTDSTLKFMLDNQVVTPEDYAMALMFDKNGNPKSEADMVALNTSALKRYRDAQEYLNLKKYGRGEANLFMDIKLEPVQLKLLTERYMRGKIRE